ncbi:MAG TPA: hypothetical protein VFR47_22355 [Anaerolineales bacterium]|nr:hypothetical protein [Anaerolineales bacterium]
MTQTEGKTDHSPESTARLIISSALLTGLCVGGTLSFPFWYGLGLYYAPASTREQLTGYLSPDLTSDFWLQGVVLGGIVWGLALGRLSNVWPLWRLGLAGGIGAFLAEVIATHPFFLGLHRALWPDAPAHIRWAMDLVFGIGLGGGLMALAIGLAIRWERRAIWLALGVIPVAAIPALIVDLVLDAIGIRWGAGNANMAKVVGLAFPCSTISTGALIGWYLAKFGVHPKKESDMIQERNTLS